MILGRTRQGVGDRRHFTSRECSRRNSGYPLLHVVLALFAVVVSCPQLVSASAGIVDNDAASTTAECSIGTCAPTGAKTRPQAVSLVQSTVPSRRKATLIGLEEGPGHSSPTLAATTEASQHNPNVVAASPITPGSPFAQQVLNWTDIVQRISASLNISRKADDVAYLSVPSGAYAQGKSGRANETAFLQKLVSVTHGMVRHGPSKALTIAMLSGLVVLSCLPLAMIATSTVTKPSGSRRGSRLPVKPGSSSRSSSSGSPSPCQEVVTRIISPPMTRPGWQLEQGKTLSVVKEESLRSMASEPSNATREEPSYMMQEQREKPNAGNPRNWREVHSGDDSAELEAQRPGPQLGQFEQQPGSLFAMPEVTQSILRVPRKLITDISFEVVDLGGVTKIKVVSQTNGCSDTMRHLKQLSAAAARQAVGPAAASRCQRSTSKSSSSNSVSFVLTTDTDQELAQVCSRGDLSSDPSFHFRLSSSASVFDEATFCRVSGRWTGWTVELPREKLFLMEKKGRITITSSAGDDDDLAVYELDPHDDRYMRLHAQRVDGPFALCALCALLCISHLPEKQTQGA